MTSWEPVSFSSRTLLYWVSGVGWSSVRTAGLQPGHYSSLPAPNFQPTATQERDEQCGNQHYSHELLVMDIVVPETCWAYKKHNKIISSIQLVLILQLCGEWSLHFSGNNTQRISFEHEQNVSQWQNFFIFCHSYYYTFAFYCVTCKCSQFCSQFISLCMKLECFTGDRVLLQSASSLNSKMNRIAVFLLWLCCHICLCIR